MQAQREVPAGAAGALVAHLRQHPEDALRAPDELASRFGLDPSFVRSVLEGVRVPQREEAPKDRAHPLAPLAKVWHGSVRLFDRLTSRPAVFVLVTCLGSIGLAFLAIRLGSRGAFAISSRGFNVRAGIIGVVALLTTFLHMAAYYRRAMSRHAVIGGLIVFAVLSGLITFSLWFDSDLRSISQRLLVTAFGMLGMLFLSLLYTGFGSLVAVLGGWVRIRMEERAEERMTRQDLLERYFELQSRLEGYPRHAPPARAWADWPPVRLLARRPFLSSLLLGAGMSLVSVLTMALVGFDSQSFQQSDTNAPSLGLLLIMLVSVVVGMLTFISYVIMGFLSGNAVRAVGCALLLSLGSVLPTLLPIGEFGPKFYLRPPILWGTVGNTVLYAIISGVAGLGAMVQRRAERNASLARNDPAAVVAEMLRIQWRLSDRATNVCVMVVDAARSAEMKMHADSLAIEYSFREYQEWIAGIAESLRGRVHSTAGDGAVVSFPSAADAFLAAKRLQTDLERFNREVNRLPTPFRLRIGLHTDEVAGDLGKMEFAEVIDVAAHVQGVSPIGGIAATEDAVAGLARSEFVPLADQVDGHRVYLALNPTEG